MASGENNKRRGTTADRLAGRFFVEDGYSAVTSSSAGRRADFSGILNGFGSNVVSIKSLSSKPGRGSLLSVSELDSLLSNSMLDPAHADVVKVIHGLQGNASISSVINSERARADLLNTISQDLEFLSSNNVYTAPQNKHNSEVVRYVNAINRVMLPANVADSLVNDRFATATIRLKGLRNLLSNSVRDKNEEAKRQGIAEEVGSVSWRKSFADFKKSSLGGVTNYVAR